MSLRRIYIAGVPTWLDEGPSFARVQGFGGRMVAEVAISKPKGSLTIPTPKAAEGQQRRNERKRAKARDPQAMVSPERIAQELTGVTDPRVLRPRCGVLLPSVGEPCARLPGHAPGRNHPGHRSRYSLDNAAKRRRKWNAVAV